MKKLVYSLSALMMACIISFSGVGGSYIQAKASSGVFDALWNSEASAWENIAKHLSLFATVSGAFVEPTVMGELIAVGSAIEFYNYMISEGYTEEEANECVHGGGGHVRDGISMDENGNVTYSDEVSDLFHGYIVNTLNDNCGYFLFKTLTPNQINTGYFSTQEKYENFVETINNIKTACEDNDNF